MTSKEFIKLVDAIDERRLEYKAKAADDKQNERYYRWIDFGLEVAKGEVFRLYLKGEEE